MIDIENNLTRIENTLDRLHQVWLAAYSDGIQLAKSREGTIFEIQKLALNHAETILKEYKKIVLGYKENI